MTDDKPVNRQHDRAVRAIALDHAVSLAERSGVGASQADAVVQAAETFRAFLTVPGGADSYVMSYADGSMRAVLPPNATLAMDMSVHLPIERSAELTHDAKLLDEIRRLGT